MLIAPTSFFPTEGGSKQAMKRRLKISQMHCKHLLLLGTDARSSLFEWQSQSQQPILDPLADAFRCNAARFCLICRQSEKRCALGARLCGKQICRSNKRRARTLLHWYQPHAQDASDGKHSDKKHAIVIAMRTPSFSVRNTAEQRRTGTKGKKIMRFRQRMTKRPKRSNRAFAARRSSPSLAKLLLL